MQISQVMKCTPDQILKKNFSTNVYQKCLILFSKILPRNTSLTILLPWQHNRFHTSPISMAFLATFGVPFSNGVHMPHPASIYQLDVKGVKI